MLWGEGGKKKKGKNTKTCRAEEADKTPQKKKQSSPPRDVEGRSPKRQGKRGRGKERGVKVERKKSRGSSQKNPKRKRKVGAWCCVACKSPKGGRGLENLGWNIV